MDLPHTEYKRVDLSHLALSKSGSCDHDKVKISLEYLKITIM